MQTLTSLQWTLLAATVAAFLGALSVLRGGSRRTVEALYAAFCVGVGGWWFTVADGPVDLALGLAWVVLGAWRGAATVRTSGETGASSTR